MHLLAVVSINHVLILILIMIVHNIDVLKSLYNILPTHTVVMMLCFPHPQQCPVGGHEDHHIIQLIHCKQMERLSIHHPINCITIAYLFILHKSDDLLSWDML